jgi:hypothetical protein
MKLFYISLILICCCQITIFGCSGSNTLVLKKVIIDPHADKDTLRQYPEKGLLILDVMGDGHLGNFSNNFIITKSIRGSAAIGYQMESDRNEEIRFSKDYIAFVKKDSLSSSGWFQVKDGKITTSLPNINSITDSLKRQYPKNYFEKDFSGYINFLTNGKIIRMINYGNIVTKFKKLNFDSLDYKLYKLSGDSLIVVSNNPNDMNLQKSGVFFIPPPGFKVIRKFSQALVIAKVTSALNMADPPNEIKINSGIR